MKVGVMGTGQLSLMMSQANQSLGVEVIPYGESWPALLNDYAKPFKGSLGDMNQLTQFVDSVDVVTFETENIPVDTLKKLNRDHKFVPGLDALQIFQDRLKEKNFLKQLDLAVTRFMPMLDDKNPEAIASYIGFPCIIKTNTGGYDGRGQKIVNSQEELLHAWIELGKAPCLVEQFVDFEQEISIVAVRDHNKNIIFYPVSENFHREGQLRLSLVSGYHPLQGLAENAIRKVMSELDYIGCMCLEFFVRNDELIVNEVSPRVHNSGHWTLDGASSSQFLKHLKAITGKYVFKPTMKSPVAMVNLIGEMPDIKTFGDSPHIKIYDYDKAPREQRKLGHMNIIGDGQEPLEFYATVASVLEKIGEKELSDYLFEKIVQVA